jgi:hypothetical protein
MAGIRGFCQFSDLVTTAWQSPLQQTQRDFSFRTDPGLPRLRASWAAGSILYGVAGGPRHAYYSPEQSLVFRDLVRPHAPGQGTTLRIWLRLALAIRFRVR